MFEKLQNKIKNFINSIRIPPLLSFIITKDGKINPTKEEALKDAPPASQNWVRLGLGKITAIGLPTWLILSLPLLVVVIRYSSEALQFLINIISQLGIIGLFAAVLYFIWKSFK